MKTLLLLATLFSLLVAVGCGTAEKKEEPPKKEEPMFEKDYKLIDAKSKKFPLWVEEPQTKNGDKKTEQKKHRYFVSSTDQVVNKRLCLKSAQTRATAQIAGEIAQLIKNEFAESAQGEADEEAENYMSETLASNTQAFLAGVSVVRTYWEKRRYLVSMGAEDDMTAYNCWALVKIPRKILKKAIKNSIKKFAGEMSNTETKQMVKDALKDTAEKMDAMTSPVKIQKEE